MGFGMTKKAYKFFKNQLHSNLAINKLPNSGEAVGLGDYISHGASALKKSAHDTLNVRMSEMNRDGREMFKTGRNGDYSHIDRAKSLFYHKNGDLAYGRVAGAAIGGSLGGYAAVNTPYRLLSGGGLFHDNDGNTDVIGIPFL